MPGVWDWRAKQYDFWEGLDLRRGPCKASLFREVAGRTLLVAVGTGLDIRHLPPGLRVAALDISEQMILRARARGRSYRGELSLVRGNALDLPFPDRAFDTAVTSCTLCSVPDPLRALRELHRVLRPGGRLLMFEHVRSRHWLLGAALDLMTALTRLGGTEMNRDTLANAVAAGFRIRRVESVFLDIILAVEAEPRFGAATS